MLTRATALFACFALAAALVARAAGSEPHIVRATFAAFPMELGGWQGRQAPPFDEKTLATLGVDDYLTRTYFSEGSAAGLYIGYWGSQRQGDTIHSPLNCLPGSGWEPVSKSTLQMQVATSPGAAPTRPISINRYVVQKGLDRELVLYWYQSHGRVVASEYMSKMFLVTDAVRSHRTDAALVRVTVRIRADGEGRAEREGARFITSLFPTLEAYLPS